jgi:hypothetical protein
MLPQHLRFIVPIPGRARARIAAACCAAVFALPPALPAAGIFLPAADGAALWRQTLGTVAADWPVVRVVAPDFQAMPPRDGLIESAWVEPPGGAVQAWPPRRQRVVVKVAPAAGGAWVDAAVETQSLAGQATGGNGIELVGDWRDEPGAASDRLTASLAANFPATGGVVSSLPPLDRELFAAPAAPEPPWARSRFPRLARAGFNVTMQDAWQRGVDPTSLGTFFSGCKDIGEGRYVLPIFGAAAATGLILEGNPAGDVVGEWGSRSLRMFVVGAPPLYAMQWVTGASRPDEGTAGSRWHMFNDNNGVSGHAFVGALPFLAAAEMVESPLLKGTLYVCSTFVGFSRMTDNAHYPSQVFLGWYLAWASARAVSGTETRFAGMDLTIVPLPMADLGGAAVQATW